MLPLTCALPPPPPEEKPDVKSQPPTVLQVPLEASAIPTTRISLAYAAFTLGAMWVVLALLSVEPACPSTGALVSTPEKFRMMPTAFTAVRSEEHTSELQSHSDLVCRLLLEK